MSTTRRKDLLALMREKKNFEITFDEIKNFDFEGTTFKSSTPVVAALESWQPLADLISTQTAEVLSHLVSQTSLAGMELRSRTTPSLSIPATSKRHHVVLWLTSRLEVAKTNNTSWVVIRWLQSLMGRTTCPLTWILRMAKDNFEICLIK